MENNKLVKLYRNIFEQGTAKGSFFITNTGLMTPRTRNITLWGLTGSSSIPPKYRDNPNVITAERSFHSPNIPVQLPAFFKFQKTPISGFTEGVSMEIATHFDTKTCYNFPAHIDQSSESLYTLASPDMPVPQSDFGSLVYSFLAKDEEFISFYKMARNGDVSCDFMAISSLIPSFVASNLPNMPAEKQSETALQIQKDYAYQYLLRDYLGDIDYTSKNAGIVINKAMGYANLAPNFDYGETLNLLVTSKFNPPTLQTIEDFPEATRPYIKPEIIERANAKKIKDYEAPVSEVAKVETFLDKSQINLNFICSAFPDVAETFRQDLQGFIQSGQLPQIIEQYTGQNDGLITPDQAKMCVEYLEERSAIFEETLTGYLEKHVPNYTDSYRGQRLYVSKDIQYPEEDPAVYITEDEPNSEDRNPSNEETIIEEYQISGDDIISVFKNEKPAASLQENSSSQNNTPNPQDEILDLPQ